MMKPCLICGTPSDDTRCAEHPARPVRKLNARQSGYDTAWDKLSRRARAAQPWCTDCGATSDLQCDHTPQAWARKAAGKPIRLQDVDVVCGPCNRDRGKARGEGVTRPNREFRGQAQGQLRMVIRGQERPE